MVGEPSPEVVWPKEVAVLRLRVRIKGLGLGAWNYVRVEGFWLRVQD